MAEIYYLGIQPSSDHRSTHISYEIILGEDKSCRAIIEVFKRRHSYATHDEIALIMWFEDYLMGDKI